MEAMARLNRICPCNTISFACKFKLYKSLNSTSTSSPVSKRRTHSFQVMIVDSVHAAIPAKGDNPDRFMHYRDRAADNIKGT